MVSVTELITQNCCNCHIAFAIPKSLNDKALADRGPDGIQFYCPKGHAQHYLGKSEADNLRDQLQWEKTKADRNYQSYLQSERSSRANRGLLTKFKNRVKNGLCPECNKSFPDLKKHMAAGHNVSTKA